MLALNQTYQPLDDKLQPKNAYSSSSKHLGQNLSVHIRQTTINSANASSELPPRNKPKLPFGFLVQQEKKELQKIVVNTNFGQMRMRPDSAKVELGVRRILGSELWAKMKIKLN